MATANRIDMLYNTLRLLKNSRVLPIFEVFTEMEDGKPESKELTTIDVVVITRENIGYVDARA